MSDLPELPKYDDIELPDSSVPAPKIQKDVETLGKDFKSEVEPKPVVKAMVETPLMRDNVFSEIFIAPEGEDFPEGAELAPNWDANVAYGSIWDSDNNSWSLPVTPLEVLKAEALEALKEEHALVLRQLTSHVTPEERDTWQPKALAALAYSEGNAADFQINMLTREAARVDETVEDLVQNVLRNNSAYHVLVGDASGHRRATALAINNAVDHISLESVLTNAKAQAETLINDYLTWVANAQA